ncbi:MAG TPA: ParA family protein [Syntrophomonadaceae bacterium]|nr:ParA family protein [Syntrophomonadaceae bacterium]
MATTIALANRKGGTGKTTSSVNIADGLARMGRRVLLIDADSQAQATTSCGFLPQNNPTSLYELLHLQSQERNTDTQIRQTIIRQAKMFDLLPSRPDLSAIELEIGTVAGRESLLRSLLVEVEQEYDFILIDLPPSLSLITINGLVAANYLIIPIELTFLSMDGLAQMMGILYRVNAELNPTLRLMGILVVKSDMRTNLARSVAQEVIKNFGADRMLPLIRTDIKLAESPSFGKSIFEYAPGCRGAADYWRLAESIVARS